ncbi:MAG TPA: hypothetical protein DIT03_10800 [Candidatus Accumulibacter sp.]|nr:hypothetical protein [Accumulibacter sp.]HCN68732.1 hypothetical protein [Accumulibacter sp.]
MFIRGVFSGLTHCLDKTSRAHLVAAILKMIHQPAIGLSSLDSTWAGSHRLPGQRDENLLLNCFVGA